MVGTTFTVATIVVAHFCNCRIVAIIVVRKTPPSLFINAVAAIIIVFDLFVAYNCLKYPTPAIGGLFYGVAPGSVLGRASNAHSEKNIYPTNQRVLHPAIKKKALGAAISQVTFGR